MSNLPVDMDKKESFEPKARWKGREILDAGHAADLDRDAAIHEFGGGLSRDEAEDRAYRDYIRKQRLAGAAHHLQSSMAAQAMGDSHGARAYRLLYDIHARELGLNPAAPPADEIKGLMAQSVEKPRKFASHPSDMLPLLRAETVVAIEDVAGPAEQLRQRRSAAQDLRLVANLLMRVQRLSR